MVPLHLKHINNQSEADQCARDVFFLMDPNFKPRKLEVDLN